MTPELRAQIGMADAIAVPLVLPDVLAFQVEGTINNQEKVNFLLDTGSDTVVITTETAQKLHLKPTKSQRGYTTIGKIKFDVAQVETISFGSLVLKDIEAQYPHRRIDYTTQLGMSVLSKYRLLVDYAQHMAYFKPVAPTADAPEVKH